jgi:hypothetical protein
MDIKVQDNGFTILEIMENLGRLGGQGANSIIDAATLAGSFAAEGRAHTEEARDLYLAYRTGYNAEVTGAEELSEETLKAQVSSFKTFMLPTVAKFGAVMWERALKVQARLSREERKASSNYNALVLANRAQKAKADCLTIAELQEILAKSEVEKDPLKELAKLAKAAAKIEKDFGIRMGEVEKAIELATDRYKRDVIARAKVAEWSEVSGETDEDIVDAEFEVVPNAPALPAPAATLN